MQIKSLLTAVVGLAILSDAAEIGRRSPFARTLDRRQNRNGNQGNRNGNGGNNNNNNGGNRGGNNGNNNNNNNGGGGNRALNQNAVQQGSQQDGNNPGADGQAASATSVAPKRTEPSLITDNLQRQCQLYQLLPGFDSYQWSASPHWIVQWNPYVYTAG